MVDAEKTYNNTIKVILTMQKKNLLKSPIAKGISIALGATIMSPLYADEAGEQKLAEDAAPAAEEQFEGTLTEVSNQKIELRWKAREPKPIGKGKVTVEKKATIAFKDIIEAKVKIIF